MAPRRNRLPPGTIAEAGASVTGPHSALTSFLREQGITSNRNLHGNPYARIPDAPSTSASADGSTAPVSTVDDDELMESSPVASGSSTPLTASTSGSKRGGAKLTPAQLKKQKLAAKDAQEGLEFNIGGSNIAAPTLGRYEDRKPGSIKQCAECGKRFTVTKYTSSNPRGPGLLCGPCSSEAGGGIAAASQAPAKRAPKKRAVKAPEERELKPVVTLQQTCIKVIGDHIDRVEELGDIGPKNLDRIAQIVCKHRALTAENLGLFLEVDHQELTLYDCTNLDDGQLSSLAVFCPHLQRMHLRMVGRMDDDVLKNWAEALRELKYLTLFAPYLCTPKGWQHFLTELSGRGQQLEGFGIQQSARFDDATLEMLVKHNPDLYNLQLSEIGKLSDLSLPLIYPLKNLTTLDISRAGVNQGMNLSDDAVVALLENVGENLVDLILDQNYLLTDRVLVEGIKIHCPRLRRLGLSGLQLVQSAGVQDLFTEWVNSGLTHLNLQRCLTVEDDALKAIIAHSGHSLRELDLHSVDELGDEVLKELANGAPALEWLDLSFVRSVDDFVVKELLDRGEKLRVLFVHGCNRVSDSAPQRKGVSIRGMENSVLQDFPQRI